MKPRRRDLLIAALLCLVATGVLLRAGRTEGFNRDEGYYFEAAELYWGWYGEIGDGVLAGKPLRAFSRSSVDRWFEYNHEHPVLMKTLYGFSWRAFHRCECVKQPGRHPVHYDKPHRTLGLLSDAEATRLPVNLFAGLVVALTYLMGLQAWSRRAGLIAAGLSLAVPQMVFHAEAACFDAPMVATWMACVYAYWRSLDDPRWSWRTGVAFGLAMATKLNGFFLPFVLLAHYLWIHRGTLRRRRWVPIPAAFLWMAVLGPLIVFGHWPWMWFDTVHRFGEYLAFHLHHVYYNMEYLGRNYNKPPFPVSYAFVMTLFTVPVTTMALAAIGAVRLVWQWNASRPQRRQAEAATIDGQRPTWKRPAAGLPTAPGMLVLLNAFFPLAVIAFTGAPIFGGTKHWLPALPFVALLAGFGGSWLCRRVAEHLSLGPRLAHVATALTVLLAWAPAVAESVRSHPYGLSHYNLLAGGPAGGADLGLNRQFWGYATRGVLPWLDAHAPRNARVYWHDTNQSILNINVREHLMRGDLGNTGLEEPGVLGSDVAMVIHEKHFNKYEYWIWDFYRTIRPALVLTFEGVPLVTVYERPPDGRLP